MDLRQLRYFIALLEHRSFVRAADAIGITQPAFSRSIQGLEQEFGCALVDRANKDLRPTPEGQVVLQHALRLVQGAANLSSEIDQMTKLDAGDLRFGCGPAPAARLVPRAVAQFVKQHPRISLSFEVDNWEKLGRSLARDEIEFFIADITQFEADPNFHTQAITPRRGVYFCRPGHPLLAKESLSTNDMFDYPIAAPKIPARARKYLANLSGRTDYHPTVTCEHLPSLVDIVRNTDAIGIATEEFFGEELQRGELVRLYWRNLPITVDESLQARCGIVSRAGYRLSAAARAMIAMIVEVDSELGQPALRTQANACA